MGIPCRLCQRIIQQLLDMVGKQPDKVRLVGPRPAAQGVGAWADLPWFPAGDPGPLQRLWMDLRETQEIITLWECGCGRRRGHGFRQFSGQSFVRQVPGPKSALVNSRSETSCVV